MEQGDEGAEGQHGNGFYHGLLWIKHNQRG